MRYTFQRNIDGIQVELTLWDYLPEKWDDFDVHWCKCNFSFRADHWLDYHRENEEIILCGEVTKLEELLTQLLDHQITESFEHELIEPDFSFFFYSSRNAQKNSSTYALLEWRVHFWEDGLTANYLSVTLGDDDITALRDYFREIIRSVPAPENARKKEAFP